MKLRLCLAASLVASSIAAVFAQPAPRGEMLTPAAPATSQPATRHATEMVVIQRGDWPIILSAPHGGRMRIPGATTRTGATFLIKKGTKTNFTTAFDGNVDAIAFRLSDEIFARTGHRPYIVVAGFTRTQVDANRAPEEAYESDAGRRVYEQYHAAIREFRSEIIGKWQRGLLIDIHGHGRDAVSIIRGTADWTSVRHLVEEFGKEAITKDLLGPLNAADNKFIPPLDQLTAPEYAALNGGYITREYGSYAGGNFDAIQFELASKYRNANHITQFCNELADGLVPFTQKYLLIGNNQNPGTQPTSAPVDVSRTNEVGVSDGVAQ